MARKKKSESQIDEILSDVQESLEVEPAQSLKSVAQKKGSIKSKYEDHAKFQKFKKEGK